MTLSAGEINDILMKANDWLLNDDRIMSVSAMAMLVETTINYACSNGSDIHQKINIVGSDYSATAKMVKSYKQEQMEGLATKWDLKDLIRI